MLDLRSLVAQARGGRVVRTGFVEANSLDRRALAADGIRFAVHGGFSDALRVVYTLYPEHIPEVNDPVRLYEISGPFSADVAAADVRRALMFDPEELGEIRPTRQSGELRAFLIAVTGPAAKVIEGLRELEIFAHIIPVLVRRLEQDEVGRGSKVRTVVVPSMRVDVVGAKGFGVSRAYFQAGIAGGKVRLNGKPASASSEIREGDSLSAEGLGRVEFKRVVSETKRGNFKLELEVSR